jgi:hypothetical protein
MSASEEGLYYNIKANETDLIWLLLGIVDN